MKRHIIIPVLAALALLGACNRQSGIVVANVGETKITAADLTAAMMMERGKYDQAILGTEKNFEEFRGQVLERLVQESILMSEAKRLGLKAVPDEIKEIEKMRAGLTDSDGKGSYKDRGIDRDAWEREQERRIIIRKLVAQEVMDKIPVSDDKVQGYYRQHVQEFYQPTQFHARQIIVDTRERAEEIAAKLKQGGDFAEIARQSSLSPDSKRGGDLGYFDAATYPEIFSEVCQQLKIGDTSDVIQTDYGFQIFQLLDKRPGRTIPFEEAASRIRQRLREEDGEKAFDSWFGALRQKAKVTINEDALKGVRIEKS